MAIRRRFKSAVPYSVTGANPQPAIHSSVEGRWGIEIVTFVQSVMPTALFTIRASCECVRRT